jgi:D-aminopeptidase
LVNQVERHEEEGVLRFALLLAACSLVASVVEAQSAPGGDAASQRPRARDLGIKPGRFDPGPMNAITDVSGVRVVQVTIVQGENVRTGATAILPHAGNMFQMKVAGAVYVYNAFGKLVGSTQANELGQIETPIVLTNTLSVWDAASALAAWTLAQPGNENVRSVNPLVGETNDGELNDIRGFHVKAEDVRKALENASAGPVEEGSVGAGAGTIAFGWKGGIGTSSRRLPEIEGSYAVGVLVQTNFGGLLTIAGVPVWKTLKPPARQTARPAEPPRNPADGSCMIVVATDAPLDARQLRRLAARAILGMGRAGSSGSNGSGDFVIAFSTNNLVRNGAEHGEPITLLGEDALSPLFEAAAEATEEAIDNSLLKATTVHGRDGHVAEAIPIEPLRALLKSAGAIQ